MAASSKPLTYIVTDIETDGPSPGANSMLSLAAAACDDLGEVIGTFTVNLAPLPGASSDARTLRWWSTQPEAWSAATKDPQPPEVAMSAYVAWIRSFAGQAMFTAHPLVFDGAWVDWYLRRFSGIRLFKGPYEGEELFAGSGLDLPSLVAGREGKSILACTRESYPVHWLGGHEHSHRALDDALGYASLLRVILSGPPHYQQ